MNVLAAIKKLFGFGPNSHKKDEPDRRLVCMDCGKRFVFDAGEQRFFRAKGFTDPKRCPVCRKKARPHFRRRRRGGNDRPGRGERSPLIDSRSPYADER